MCNLGSLTAATQRTWAIAECRNVGTYFLTITEILSEVHTNYFSNFWAFFVAFHNKYNTPTPLLVHISL